MSHQRVYNKNGLLISNLNVHMDFCETVESAMQKNSTNPFDLDLQKGSRFIYKEQIKTALH